MKPLFPLLLAGTVALSSGCAISTKDLANNLRYSNNKPVGVENIKFQNLRKMRRGDACTWHLFFILPLYGDGSIITAADKGEVNSVQLIGETGHWYGPVNKSCTVVFGDKDGIGVKDVISHVDKGEGSNGRVL